MPPQNLDDILKATGQPGDSAPVDSSNPVAAAPSSSSSLQPTTLTNPQHIGTLDSVLQQTGQPEEVPQDVQKKQGMIEQLKQEVAGPGTVLGEAPEAGAGVRRMLQGDIVGGAKQAAQGYKKMAGASLTKGSEQIDAQKHPILKAGLEFAEGMTSPINLGMVAASGGLGMIDSAAKVYMVHQLANAGLTSEQIMSLYNNFPEIKKAWDAGDSSKVLYEGTHMLLSGALAIAGAQDMAGKPMEAATEGERALIQKGKEAVVGAATAVKEAPGKVAARVRGALAAPEAEVKSNPVEDLKAAFPPSKTNPYNEQAPQVAYNALAAEHKLNTIHDPQEAAEALQNQISQAENKVMDQAIKQVPDEPILKNNEPVSVWNEVQNQLQSRKIAKEGFVDDAMKELEKFGIKKDQKITVSDADRIRRQLNDETTSIEKKPEYQQVRIENVDPKYAALQVAKDVLRDGVYDTVDAHGLDKGVTARDFRRDIIGNLISFRNAMLDKALGPDQQVKGTAPEAPKEGLARQVARAGITTAGGVAGATVGSALGPIGTGAGGGAGALAASKLAERAIPKPEVPEDLTRSELLGRALNHPEADKFVTETPEEQQIRGNIQQPQVPAARGQGEIPFGPPEIFGENQGEVSPLEMRSEQLEKISTYINKLRETIENPAATSVEKDAAQHQLELVFGGKIPEGFKRPKEQGAANLEAAPKLLQAQSRFEAPGEIKSRTGLDTKAVLNHELAHAALAHMAGLEPLDVISSKHMEADPSTIAAVRIGWPKDMLKREDGTLEPRALKERLPDVLATYMAGAAANELYDGIKYEDNKSLKSDIQEVENTLDLLGLSAAEKDRFIEWGMTRAKATLQDPDVEDLINEFSDTRERGLPESHHYSAARMLEFRDRLDKLGGRYANNPEGTNVNNPEHGQTEQPAREKQPTAVNTGEVAEAERTSEVRVPPERTTGAHDEPIKAAGAIPGGIMRGDPDIDVPDLILFHDPTSGSTLALPPERLTKENVQAELEKSREQYRQAAERKKAKK
jgi:cysteinyl-tRNA synthetase